MIRIRHLRKEYPNVTPLADVNADIRKGDVISVIGPSGTGKSTLIRCLNLLETPTSGEIWVDGVCLTDKKCDTAKIRQKMGMVFQNFNLFHHLTVIENLMAAPTTLLGHSKQQAYDNGMKLLRMVGLADKALNYPDELSGGQKQRAAIARTLAMEPEIILLDEPTSALDPTMVGEVQTVIRDLAKRGLTMMIVTHDMRFAKEVVNRVFYMDEGGIYEDGSPDQIFDHPQREKTIRFIRQIRTLEYRITSRDFDFIGLNSSIEDFGRKNQMSQKTILRTQSLFEEICMQILLPELPEDFALQFLLEYSQKEECASMDIRYSGKRFDPRDSENVLSLKLVENAAKSMEYSEIRTESFTNQITVKIK